MDLFKDIIYSLLQSNEYKLNSDEDISVYNPFIVNKALSQHVDTLFFANEMNLNSHLDKKLQYDFYFYGLRKYKRPYQKWLKNDKDKDIENIKELYGYSTQQAKEVYSIFTDQQLEEIANKVNKGGQKSN